MASIPQYIRFVFPFQFCVPLFMHISYVSDVLVTVCLAISAIMLMLSLYLRSVDLYVFARPLVVCLGSKFFSMHYLK